SSTTSNINTYCFFSTATAPTAIYTLSLHDALPISALNPASSRLVTNSERPFLINTDRTWRCRTWNRLSRSIPTTRKTSADLIKKDRKSTRLNSSHVAISYAVFCLKKKKKIDNHLIK